MNRSLVAGLGVLALLAAPAATSAHDRPANGRILWSRFNDDTFTTARVVSANADGSGLRVLSRGREGEQDLDPMPSPRGGRVIFERDTEDGSVGAIVLMNADGSRQRTVDTGCHDPCVDDIAPGWTPDGNHMTFTRVVGPLDVPSEVTALLQVANLDGSHVRRLSQRGIDGVYEDYRARYLPDGRITFIRIRSADIRSAVFVMDGNGRHVRQLTPWELDADTHDVSIHGLVVFETYAREWPEGQGDGRRHRAGRLRKPRVLHGADPVRDAQRCRPDRLDESGLVPGRPPDRVLRVERLPVRRHLDGEARRLGPAARLHLAAVGLPAELGYPRLERARLSGSG